MGSVAPLTARSTPDHTLEAPPAIPAKERYKKTRKDAQLTQKAIETELDIIAARVERLIIDSSKKIGVDVSELTGQFLARSAATHEKKPTAWNGLVSKVSLQLAHKKEDPEFKGAAFMRHVVQYIHENNLYKDLTDSQKEELAEYAQKVRDSRVSAGQVKTVDQRLTQGSVKDEVFAMFERLGHLHSLLGIEFVALTVRGSSTQGLKPIYATSPKARQFFESHLKLEMADVLTLFAESVVNGAAGVAKTAQKTKLQLKTTLRELLTDLLRDAAIKPASDGWEPITEERYSIKMSYVNFKQIKETYGVEVYGWPIEENGSMRDPSNLGGSQALRQWIAKVESGHVGFNRMTKDEYKEWLKEYREELANETIKVRSKAKAQKRPAVEPSSSVEPPQKKTKGKKATIHAKKTGSTGASIAAPTSPATATTEVSPTLAETIDPAPALAPTVLTPFANSSTPLTLRVSDTIDIITSDHAYEPPPSFNQQTIPSMSDPDVYDLSTYCFPSFGFSQTGPTTLTASPTYPLVSVRSTQLERGGTQRARHDSITSQTSIGSTQSHLPTTPTISQRRKDNFVNTSPAEWLEQSQKPRRRRTQAASSTPSRTNTPSPQIPHIQSQSSNIASTSGHGVNNNPIVSLYRSELADPRM